jgi:hypothetical protein
MITIPIEPFWTKLNEHHQQYHTDEEFWDWLKREYNAYQVYIVSDPGRTEPDKAYGLLFGEEAEATFFTLKWS